MKPSKRGKAARFIGSSPFHVDVWAKHGRDILRLDQAVPLAAASWKAQVPAWQQAFLHAGACSLIAPQIKVHPDYAQQLAIRFYTEWLKGDVTKAQALRQAQLQMREQGVETVHWSHHILVGDYR